MKPTCQMDTPQGVAPLAMWIAKFRALVHPSKVMLWTTWSGRFGNAGLAPLVRTVRIAPSAALSKTRSPSASMV